MWYFSDFRFFTLCGITISKSPRGRGTHRIPLKLVRIDCTGCAASTGNIKCAIYTVNGRWEGCATSTLTIFTKCTFQVSLYTNRWSEMPLKDAKREALTWGIPGIQNWRRAGQVVSVRAIPNYEKKFQKMTSLSFFLMKGVFFSFFVFETRFLHLLSVCDDFQPKKFFSRRCDIFQIFGFLHFVE